MNKAQKEVQQAHLKNEKHVIELLKKVYEQASKDCDERIRELSARTDFENLQSVIYQKRYQEALKTQLSSIMDNLQTEQYTTIDGYLQNCYKNGYTGAMYDIANQGIPVVMPIRQDQVVKAVQTNSKLSEGLYKRLGEDTKYLKRSVRAELSRGIANGSSWNDMAQHIANGMKSPYNQAYNRAVVIARTEGHRVQQESGLDACKAAKKKGADVVKQWDATLDGRTRPEHREADGQIKELDDDFDVGGEKLEAPGIGGSAWNVCNCRCCMLQRARWALDEDELQTLKDRAAYFGLDKKDDFKDFKKKYLELPDDAYDTEQYYRPITISKASYPMTINRKKQLNINVKKVESYGEGVYISENTSIKPKALHQINQNTIKALGEYGLSYEKKPTIVIASADEIGGMGKYDAISNTVYYIPEIADKKKEPDQKHTEYHEMWHVKQASDYGTKITKDNYAEYMETLVKKAKKNIDKLGITRENVSELSPYAKDCYNVGRYDEVEAEYMAVNRK